MKTILQLRLLCIFWFAFSGCMELQAQVGINTTTPEGILDVDSGITGVVLPRIALTATNVAAPVQNPQGGNLAVGTVIYNTNSTSTGSNDVFPGIYVWTGTEWFNKFPKKEYKLYKQSAFFRTRSNAGYEDVPGLANQTFTPKYSGTYKIEINVHFGAGEILNQNGAIDIAVQTGNFRFRINGNTYNIPASAYSTLYYKNVYAIWEQCSIIEYVSLEAGVAYNFDLEFDQDFSQGFFGNGNNGRGRGYVGIPDHVPCFVEFTHIGD